MQSYKLRKTSETALFPIEHELRLMRQENDRSWTTLMSKILSIVFSGIGTTILSQDIAIPALLEYIICEKLNIDISIGWMIVLQILLAMGVFVLLSFAAIKIINFLDNSKDNKKNSFERENLVEVFHKIILNNIITGKSFTKKSKIKLGEMQSAIRKYKEGKPGTRADELQIRETKREIYLYSSEAVYYFRVAERQLKDKKIIEIGNRPEYREYIKEIGVATLIESLLMYEKSVDELNVLYEELRKSDYTVWDESEFEQLSIDDNQKEIERITKSILDWKTNLMNTVKEKNNL